MQRKINVYNIVLLLISMAVFACNPPAKPADTPNSDTTAAAKEPGKWLPYNERLEQEEKALRASQKVKTVTVYASTASTDAKGEFLSESKTYDRQGNLTQHVTYGLEKKAVRETRNTYRDDLLMESVVDNAKGQSFRAHYQYTEDGNRLRETLIKPAGDTLLYRSYRYDADGNETEARMVNPERGLDLRKTTTYDAQGRPDKVSEVNDTTVIWTESYSYAGSKWTTIRTSGAGKVMGIYKSAFDARDHATAIENLSPDGEIRLAIHYTYDAKGRLRSSDYLNKDGNSTQRLEYTYNKKGLLQQQHVTLPGSPIGKISRMEYTLYGEGD